MSDPTAKAVLRSFVERIERLEEEKKSIADDIKDVYAEAKATGFDTKALRAIIKMRKVLPDERAEHEAVLGTYMAALGMFSHIDVGDVDEQLARKRTEAGKSKTARAPAKKESATVVRPGFGGALTPDQVKAAADRAEERASSKSCAVKSEKIMSSLPSKESAGSRKAAVPRKPAALPGSEGAQERADEPARAQPRPADPHPSPGGADAGDYPEFPDFLKRAPKPKGQGP